jgi:diadenosine tetraphosphatase ApaH/serine/threonine PP2A family protein phosphatase
VRYLILSDIHANIDALDAVLESVDGDWSQAVILGDLVGYGGEPNAVVERIRNLHPQAIIRGNHDKAAAGLDDAESFNQVARFAALWTGEILTPENRDYLLHLPPGPVVIDDRAEICHGSPFDEDHYIFDSEDALRALESCGSQLCLFGHTHQPMVFHSDGRAFGGFVPEPQPLHRLELRNGVRYVVNPGSVGQPRDGDPRSAFGLYDSEARVLELRRVEYSVEAAQRRILSAGLPAGLANRLAVGR